MEEGNPRDTPKLSGVNWANAVAFVAAIAMKEKGIHWYTQRNQLLMETLHTGQSAFCSSQVSMHSWWNWWRQGRMRSVSPAEYVSRHTEQHGGLFTGESAGPDSKSGGIVDRTSFFLHAHRHAEPGHTSIHTGSEYKGHEHHNVGAEGIRIRGVANEESWARSHT